LRNYSFGLVTQEFPFSVTEKVFPDISKSGRIWEMLWIQEAGQGPPLVLLHAVGTSGSIWWQHVPRLSKQFHVIAVDLSGHGRSPKPEQPVSVEGMAEDLHKTLQKQSLLPAHFVGLSLGGMVAQMLVAKHPSSLASLTLCDTICEVSPDTVKILEERAKAVEKGGMIAILESTLERWFSPGFASKHADVVAKVKKLLFEADPVINAQTWRAIGKLNVVSQLKSAPKIPALVVNGSLDTGIPPDVGKRLCDLFDASLMMLSGCAHMAPLEAPDEFMDYLESFLSGIEPV
jgi:3-oxoadipate enol-lactonase